MTRPAPKPRPEKPPRPRKPRRPLPPLIVEKSAAPPDPERIERLRRLLDRL